MRALTNALLAVLLLLLGVFHVLQSGSGGYGRVLEANWGVSLVDSRWEVLYEDDNTAGFHGDGVRYHVFRRPEGGVLPQAADDAAYQAEKVSGWLDLLDTPESRRPGADAVPLWYALQQDGSEIVVLCSGDGQILYVVESFL